MLHPLPPRGPHPPRTSADVRAPSASSTGPSSATGSKHSWAGAATPTQPRSVTQASATTERLDNDMFNRTPLTGEGNPTWPFSNAPETMTPWRNDLLQSTIPPTGASAGLGARAVALVTATLNEVSAWLADIPRRIGARLFLDLDEEAHWRGWQVTPLHGGLGRDYRDHRFQARSAPAGPADQVPAGQAPPDGDQ